MRAADAPPPGFYAPDPYAATWLWIGVGALVARRRLVRLGVVVDAREEGRRPATHHLGPALAAARRLHPADRPRARPGRGGRDQPAPGAPAAQRPRAPLRPGGVGHPRPDDDAHRAQRDGVAADPGLGGRRHRSTPASSARARRRPSWGRAPSPSRWWRDGAERPRPQVAGRASASGRSSPSCSRMPCYRLHVAPAGTCVGGGRQLERADRAAGVPPGAAPAPDPDGRARVQRRAPRRGGARGRGPTARHHDRQAPDPQPRHHAVPRHLRLDGRLRRDPRVDVQDARLELRGRAHRARHLQLVGRHGLPAHRRLRLHQRRARLRGARADGRPGVRLLLRRHLQRSRHLAHRRRPRHVRLQLRQGRPPARPLGRLRHRQPPRRAADHRRRRGRRAGQGQGRPRLRAQPRGGRGRPGGGGDARHRHRHRRTLLRDERPGGDQGHRRRGPGPGGDAHRRRLPRRSTPTTRRCRSRSPGSGSSASSGRAGGGRRDPPARRPVAGAARPRRRGARRRLVEPVVALGAGGVAGDALATHGVRSCSSGSPRCVRPSRANRSTPRPPTSTSTSSSTRRAASSPRTTATGRPRIDGVAADISRHRARPCRAPATPSSRSTRRLGCGYR